MSVLTRDPSTADLPQAVTVIKADYSSAEALTPSLAGRNFDALVILLNRRLKDEMIRTIDAGVAAGIPHVIPSAFARPWDNPALAEEPFLQSPYFAFQHLMQKAAEGRLTWNSFNTGVLWNWAMDHDVFASLLERDKPTRVVNGGDLPMSFTHTDDVGRAVAVSLQNLDRAVNRAFFVQNIAVSQNRVLELARELDPDREFPVIDVDLSKVTGDGTMETPSGPVKLAEREIVGAQMVGGKYRMYWDQDRAREDNELLEVEAWGEGRLRREISMRVKTPNDYVRTK